MYSRLMFSARAWLDYFMTARTIHQVDSPFVFEFCREVLEKNDHLIPYKTIETLRKELLSDPTILNRVDLGAGSVKQNQPRLTVGQFIRQSSVKADHGKLLNRIARFCRPSVILELGTAGGISGAYWLAGQPQVILMTIEGDPAVAALAGRNFKRLGLSSAQIIEGNFDTVLPSILEQLHTVDLVFIDGHHTGDALKRYIKMINPFLNPKMGMMVLDDIYWNHDMARAWGEIKLQSDWPLRIDLFQFGLLIKNPDLIHQENIALIASRYKPWLLGLFR